MTSQDGANVAGAAETTFQSDSDLAFLLDAGNLSTDQTRLDDLLFLELGNENIPVDSWLQDTTSANPPTRGQGNDVTQTGTWASTEYMPSAPAPRDLRLADPTIARSLPSKNSSQGLQGPHHELALIGAVNGPRTLPPKIGTRFSKESARVLRRWLNNHAECPFPTQKEKDQLASMTGLTSLQVATWFANARRRRKTAQERGRHTLLRGQPETSDGGTPIRPGTPVPREADPLERWMDSPPEDEPASPEDIARAVSSDNGSLPGRSLFGHGALSEDTSGRSSMDETSASSMEFSGSQDSSYSRESSRRRRPRKSSGPRAKRRRPVKEGYSLSLFPRENRFQCTFCTESFKKKYEWQRHEKTLHVPLEQWMCTPNGPRNVNPGTGLVSCVFCGESTPSDEHLERHNALECTERAFSRKDHLKQHLRLAHHAEGADWAIQGWKAPTPDIRSRCGFCDMALSSWADRADHLADHFKAGLTMADWSGDWGFDEAVLKTVEKYIPPYMVDHERKSAFPFRASQKAPDSPRCAFELLSLELSFFTQRHFDECNLVPSNGQIQLEACRIIFASEALSPKELLPPDDADDGGDEDGGDDDVASWLRDLITSDANAVRQARLARVRCKAESRLSSQEIKGNRTLFEFCPLEVRLREFVVSFYAAHSTMPPDHVLQGEAGRVLDRVKLELAPSTPDYVKNWLVTLMISSSSWLAKFKKRVHRLLTQEGSSTLCIKESPDSGGPEDQGLLLHIGQDIDPSLLLNSTIPEQPMLPFNEDMAALQQPIGDMTATLSPTTSATDFIVFQGEQATRPAWLTASSYVLNDANFHRWLWAALKRWALTTMSPSNPDCHVPTDFEIQAQARFFSHNDSDPWCQTHADVPEWLARFKMDVGIYNQPGG